MPWTQLIIGTIGAVVLLILVRWAYAAVKRMGAEEVRRTLAESEAERRARDAVESAKPMRERPFTGPGGVFHK